MKAPLTYMKWIVRFILVNAVLWVWCSYVLAFFGKEDIAESLSETAITSILGTVVTYGIKSAVEKISDYGYVGKVKPKNDETKRDC